MKYYYHVFIGAKHIDLVQAFTGEHAIQIAESKFGPARKYSKDNEYRAVRA
jgi:hypothetical protein